MCEIMTDNRNRTASEVRKLFEVHGGKLGATGCVAYLFDRKGLVLIPTDKTDEDTLMELALETGADDVRSEGENFVVTCEVDVYSDVCESLEQASIETSVKQVTRIPNSTVDLDVDVGRKVIKLMEALDDHDDVQNVAANFNLPEEAMAELAGD
jgi:YebC/PmpR family DNA-binding regulatory protein